MPPSLATPQPSTDLLREVDVVGRERRRRPSSSATVDRPRRARARPRARRRRPRAPRPPSFTAGPSRGPSTLKFGLRAPAAERVGRLGEHDPLHVQLLGDDVEQRLERASRSPARCTTASASGWRTRVLVSTRTRAAELDDRAGGRHRRRRGRGRRAPSSARRGSRRGGRSRARPSRPAARLRQSASATNGVNGASSVRDRRRGTRAGCGTRRACRRRRRRPGSRTGAATGARTSSTGRRRTPGSRGRRRWRRRPRAVARLARPCAASCESDPAVDAAGARRRRAPVASGSKPLGVRVGDEERVDVPQRQQELPHDLVEDLVADAARGPRRAVREHEPAQRVGALAVERLPRVEDVAERLRHLAAVGVDEVARGTRRCGRRSRRSAGRPRPSACRTSRASGRSPRR